MDRPCITCGDQVNAERWDELGRHYCTKRLCSDLNRPAVKLAVIAQPKTNPVITVLDAELERQMRAGELRRYVPVTYTPSSGPRVQMVAKRSEPARVDSRRRELVLVLRAQGLRPDQILERHPHLTRSEVYGY